MIPTNPPTLRTYQGRRTDLLRRRDWEEESEGPPTRDELEAFILQILPGHVHGLVASQIAEFTMISKEWARQILLRMEKRGLVRCDRRHQFHIWYDLKVYDSWFHGR